MKSVIRYVLATVAMVLMAQGAFAALSPEYANFAKGPIQFLMTKDELAKFNTLKTDEEAKAFIDLFWLRRDPSPNTPVNELKDAIDQRIKLADERFGTRRVQGSMSDRGHMLVVLGQPTENVKQEKMPALAGGAMAGGTDEDSTGATPNMPRAANGMKQTFTYDPAKIAYKPLAAALGSEVVNIVFTDPTGSGDFRLERSRKGPDFNALYDKVAAAYVINPNASLTQTTTTTTTTTTKTTVATGAQASAGTIKTAALQTAVDEVKSGKTPVTKGVAIGYAEFVAPSGDYFVPVDFYVSKSAGLTADSADTFFGVITDANGALSYAFEEPAKLSATKEDFYVDKTLNLGTGKYNAVLGLAKAGTPVAMATATLDLNSVAKDAAGTSKLVLSNNVFEATEAAPVKAPFAFGKLKIVPKSNLVFSNKDELTYFVELHNPGLDPATNLPKFQVKLELSGGKLTRPITAPLSDAAALPLSGAPGPGQYAIISSIPLGEMSKPLDPGDYTLKMKLIDTVTKQSYNLEQSFKIGS